MAALVSIVVRLILFALVGWIYILGCLIPFVGPIIADDLNVARWTGKQRWQACPGPKFFANESCGQLGALPLTCPIAVMRHFAGFGSLIADVPNDYRHEVKSRPPMGGTSWRTRGCRGARSGRCSWTECAKTTSRARKAWPRHPHPWG